MEIFIVISLKKDCSSHKEGGICHDREQLGGIRDLEYRPFDVFF